MNLEIGPGGDLFYPDFDGGSIRRITFGAGPGPGPGGFLSDMTPTFAANGFGPMEPDRSNGEDGSGDGGPITLNGVGYTKGIGVHAASDLRYNLGGACTTFSAQIGVDDEVGSSGSVVFSVIGDGSTLFMSPTMTGTSATAPIQVPITGVQECASRSASGATAPTSTTPTGPTRRSAAQDRAISRRLRRSPRPRSLGSGAWATP